MKFDFLKTMQIYFVFHINLLQLAVNDFLFSQHAESQESVVITDSQHIWYVNSILDFKYDHCCQSHLLKYLVNWENHCDNMVKKNKNLVWIAVLQEFKAKKERKREEKWAAASYINRKFWFVS